MENIMRLADRHRLYIGGITTFMLNASLNPFSPHRRDKLGGVFNKPRTPE